MDPDSGVSIGKTQVGLQDELCNFRFVLVSLSGWPKQASTGKPVARDRATALEMETTDMITTTIKRWHDLVEARNPQALDDLLADEVMFHSPVVHTPQEGKAITKLYLTAALHTLNNEHFHYTREVLDGNNAVLEFTTELEGIQVNGVDMIRCDGEGRIVDFKVMVRPLKAVNKIHAMMAAMLEKMAPGKPA